MIVHQTDRVMVTYGIFRGFRVRDKASGRVARATPWLKRHLAEMHAHLKQRGFDSMNDDDVKAAFWDYFIELFEAPPDGLFHRAVASMPLDEAAGHVLLRL